MDGAISVVHNASKRVVELLLLVIRLAWILLRAALLAPLPRRKKDLIGEVVLVTGAAQGMGKTLAISLAELGAKVVLWDINEEKLQVVAQEITENGGSAHWYVCDVTSETSVKDVARRVQQEVGEVMVLVNNAGVMQNVPLLELSGNGIRRTLEVNLLAHFWTIRAFLPDMEKRGRGHIVAISSCAGLVGHINQTDYSASKHGVVGLMEALSEELRVRGSDVKLTTICPMTVNTGMNQNPKTRWSWLAPVVSVDDAVRQIVSAIRREDFLVTIPSRMLCTLRINKLLPRQIHSEIMDFTDYCRVKNSL